MSVNKNHLLALQGEWAGTRTHCEYPAMSDQEAAAFQSDMQSWEPALSLRFHSTLICATELPPGKPGPRLQGATPKTYMELRVFGPRW